jgi:hypothetical protein
MDTLKQYINEHIITERIRIDNVSSFQDLTKISGNLKFSAKSIEDDYEFSFEANDWYAGIVDYGNEFGTAPYKVVFPNGPSLLMWSYSGCAIIGVTVNNHQISEMIFLNTDFANIDLPKDPEQAYEMLSNPQNINKFLEDGWFVLMDRDGKFIGKRNFSADMNIPAPIQKVINDFIKTY